MEMVNSELRGTEGRREEGRREGGKEGGMEGGREEEDEVEKRQRERFSVLTRRYSIMS